mgnify:FL=1
MKSLEELRAIREGMKGKIGNRDIDETTTKIVVGMATCGISAGSRPVLNKLSEEISSRGLENVVVEQTGCIGMCQFEPIVEVFVPGQDKVTYVKMTAAKATDIIEKHIIGGELVNAYTLEKMNI